MLLWLPLEAYSELLAGLTIIYILKFYIVRCFNKMEIAITKD